MRSYRVRLNANVSATLAQVAVARIDFGSRNRVRFQHHETDEIDDL